MSAPRRSSVPAPLMVNSSRNRLSGEVMATDSLCGARSNTSWRDSSTSVRSFRDSSFDARQRAEVGREVDERHQLAALPQAARPMQEDELARAQRREQRAEPRRSAADRAAHGRTTTIGMGCARARAAARGRSRARRSRGAARARPPCRGGARCASRARPPRSTRTGRARRPGYRPSAARKRRSSATASAGVTRDVGVDGDGGEALGLGSARNSAR